MIAAENDVSKEKDHGKIIEGTLFASMPHFPDDQPRNNPETAQEHSGKGDNVGRDKVDQRDATVYSYAPDAQGANIVSGQSVSGNVIKIINYYYHEDTRIKTEEKADEYIPCPYRGLYHFSPQDAEFFFGRDVFIEELYNAVQSRNFVAVLGASGSGKSSVVFAGLVPRLVKETHWLFTHFRPGSDPFFALAMALVPLYNDELNNTEKTAQANQLAGYLLNKQVTISNILTQIQQKHFNQKILIIGDQFEELYTLCKEIKTRENFLDSLIECLSFSQSNSSSKITTVITMRADFLGSALGYRPFADKLQNSDLKLGSMNEDEIRDVIVKPAEKQGSKVEESLVDNIINSVKKESASLPLLEFALTLLWKEREGVKLSYEAYKKIGKVEGALTKYADQQFNELNPQEQELTRRIFIQLVRPGEGTEDTRRVSLKDEIGEANWELVKKLADSRLVVTSKEENQQETVEVVHETLIRNWGQLRQWMEKDRDFRAWQERLRASIKQWENTGKDPGSLLRGVSLGEAEQWLGKRGQELSASEINYLQESIKLRDELIRREDERKRREEARKQRLLDLEKKARKEAEERAAAEEEARLEALKAKREAEEKAKAENQAKLEAQKRIEVEEKARRDAEKNNQKLRNRAWLLGGISALAIGIAIFAVLSWRDSRERAVKASLREMASQSQLLLPINPLEGLLLAIQAVGINEQKLKGRRLNEVHSSLFKATEESRERLQLRVYEGKIRAVEYRPDGESIVSGDSEGKLRVWDSESGELLQTLTGHKGWVLAVGYSPDGKNIVSGGRDGTMKIWDSESGELLQTLTEHKGPVKAVGYSPNGKNIVSGGRDGTMKIWDSESGESLQTLTEHEGQVNAVGYSPDGKNIVSGSSDTTVRVWDSESGELLQTLTKHEDQVNAVGYSPDGKNIVSGSIDNTVRVWDSESGTLLQTLTEHKGDVLAVEYSPDGETIVSGSIDDTVRVWNSESGTLLQTLPGHLGWVNAVGYSPDGKNIVSGSTDGTARVWDLESEALLQTLTKHEGYVLAVGYSPDGKNIVSGSIDGTVRVWDLESGELLQTLTEHKGYVLAVGYSPDGQTIVSGDSEGTVRVWDLENGELLQTLTEHKGYVLAVGYSPDGQTIVSGDSEGTVRVWDSTSGHLSQTLTGHEGPVNAVEYSPNGKNIVSGSSDTTVRVWNATNGHLLQTLTGYKGWVLAVGYSPDGKNIVSGSSDDMVRVWDATSGHLSQTLTGHEDEVLAVSYSPDGKNIVSASSDTTIKVWDQQNILDRACKGLEKHPILIIDPIQDKQQGQLVEAQIVQEAEETCFRLSWNNLQKAHFRLEQGLGYAQYQGNIKEAEKRINQAGKLDQKIDEKKNQEKSQVLASQYFIKQGVNLAKNNQIKEAITKFEKAHRLDSTINLEYLAKQAQNLSSQYFIKQGVNLAKNGQIQQAIINFKKAESLHSDSIKAKSWNILCWWGSLNESAKDVLFACDKAVTKVAERGDDYRDERALARVLTGDYNGAIDDLEKYISDKGIPEEARKERKKWLQKLKNNENPFTNEILEELKNKENNDFRFPKD